VYTTAGALSPDYKVKDDPTTGNLFGSGLGRVNRINGHDLMWRLKHLPIPQVSVLVADSKHGEKGYAQTLAFIKAVKAPMRVVSILPDQGSHNFPTWTREMPATLKWMNQQLTFPQDVVPRHHRTPAHTTVRASGVEPSRTATRHR
jgi:hypothetical protein